jgi:hypothetical protein
MSSTGFNIASKDKISKTSTLKESYLIKKNDKTRSV